MSHLRLAALALASLTTLAACGDGPVTPLPREIGVRLDQVPDTLGVGDSLRLAATVTSSDPHWGADVAWASRAPAVVGVDSAGHARALATGDAWLVASVANLRAPRVADSVRVRVVAESRSLRATVPRDSLVTGEVMTVALTADPALGAAVAEGSVRFVSSDTFVVRVDSLTGDARVVGDGDATVSASTGARRASVALRAYIRPLETGGVRLTTLAIGRLFGCGLDAGGVAYCWGRNQLAQLGRGTRGTLATELPFAPVQTTSRYTMLGAGRGGACGVTTMGTLECWGWTLLGVEADPDRRMVPRVVPLPDGFGAIASISIGVRFNPCVIDVAGRHACWGDNPYNALGGPWAATVAPRPVPGAPAAIRSIATGEGHGCATDATNAVFCWGQYSSAWGASAVGTRTDTSAVATTAPAFRQVTAGFEGTCGLAPDGQAWCGGFDWTINANRPQTRIDGATSLDRMVGGFDNVCGVRASGEVLCWNTVDRQFAREGLYGYLRATPFSRRVQVTEVSAGPHQVCGITTSGATLCRDNSSFTIQ